ncbi:unnamed protein product [Phaedon cochleariae]|uniref:Uncharacterized protein n=1 Tax=Phaedon cochleariae TaxID=80249 RepID=A0A9N9X0R5_PHACE|nr:unnamed protein product [Phaedon cochleariae]
MVQSLGPMTTLLSYIGYEPQYRDKWLAAAKRTFALTPDIDQLLSEEIHKKNASEIRHLTGMMSDICRIATTRPAIRAFLPLCMMAFATADDTNWAHAALVRPFTLPCGKMIAELGLPMIRDLIPRINGKWNESEADQVMYHCVFGTFKEDLGVLADITDCGNWYTRKELGSKFKKHNI